ADPHARIAGTLVVAPSVKDAVKPGDVIFVVARAQDGAAKGVILGARRYVAGQFPLAFELDNRDAMMPGAPFAGHVAISARVDKDGDASTKNPGDVIGASDAEVGAKDVR